jgi:hypothetical protein
LLPADAIVFKQGGGQSVRLWSFEVKKELNSSNVRKSFFQAVSNSSWANEGYLVAVSIVGEQVEQELRGYQLICITLPPCLRQ